MDSSLLWWTDFSHRFTPFVAARIRGDLSKIPATVEIPQRKLDEEYRGIVERLDEAFPEISFLRQPSRAQIEKATDVLQKHLGFRLVRRRSTIEAAGEGIFVEEGRIRQGAVASVYPGTIYDPWDPIFLQSIGNHFVLRCQDGVTIDGNDRRLSRYIHRSSVFRDLAPCVSDLSWLSSSSAISFNFLNSGQYVNNGGAERHNVQYLDLDINGWPQRLRRFLPYAVYSPMRTAPLRVVLLVASRDIEEGEELLSAYISK